jgi:hypothetical protein
MRRIAAKFVPWLLTNDQKQRHINVCLQLREKANEDPTFLNSRPAAPFFLLVIVGSSAATIVALFLDHNHTSKSNIHHPLWS